MRLNAVPGSVPQVTDIQSLYGNLVTQLGSSNVSLTTTADGVLLASINAKQTYAGNLTWAVDHSQSMGVEFSATGSAPATITYSADIPLGIVLNPAGDSF